MSERIERTFAMLKPETIMRGLIGEIIGRVERRGLKIVAMKMVQVSPQQAEKLYRVHKGKHFYHPLIKHTLSGPVVVMVMEGPNAVRVLRQMIGATHPAEAEVGTIRGDFGLTMTKNIIHAADTLENAKKEIKIFFKPSEILSYKKPAESTYIL